MTIPIDVSAPRIAAPIFSGAVPALVPVSAGAASFETDTQKRYTIPAHCPLAQRLADALDAALGPGRSTVVAIIALPGLGRFDLRVTVDAAAIKLVLHAQTVGGRAWAARHRAALAARMRARTGRPVELTLGAP